jgi:tetratricopeptide (TPR) repeat protein
MDKPTVFISYSHKDERWKDALRPHLKALEQAGQITIWDDRQIDAGSEWYDRIKEVMERAAVAVCLISADYLASDFCVKEEIPYLLERRQRDGMGFIPVLIRPCPWFAHTWLEEKQMLPRDGKSISEDFQGREDGAFLEVARAIFKIVTDPNYRPPAPPPPRWAPPDKLDLTRLPFTGSDLFGRQAELTLLDEAWATEATNVISFVAWGGVGKSTLVNKWLERLAKDNYRGARRVYAWSFYSQGTSERATSADLFINTALSWFGDPEPTAGSPWDKGERLAELVRREKTLLLLDGMEPLQSALAYERGKIKDPALSTLVEELARDNPGLCVITTRERIRELDEESPAGAFVVPPSGGSVAGEDTSELRTHVQQINLELLSPEAGRALLRVGGVRGPDEELEKATQDFGCHALALNLLAVYLQDIPGHHIAAAAQLPALDLPVEAGQHPRRLIAAFEQRFGDGPEVNVLRLLGLFDRPADGASIAALRQAPAIPGLTDHIQASAEAAWLRALQRLRKYKLIAEESHHAPNELDAHPLVREHFADQLQRAHPKAWKAGNLRLYEHLTRTAKKFPDTIEEMTPLFAAVTHGCAAGHHQEVFRDVYRRRIHRGNQFFSTKYLGAYNTDLAALRNFLAVPWLHPVSTITKTEQSFVLNAAGFELFALGRLREAVRPMQTGLAIDLGLEDWDGAATVAINLCELFLTLGEINNALIYARQGMDLADRSYRRRRMESRARLADALHQAGRLAEAEAAFQEAQTLASIEGIEGFFLCDLLLTLGKVQEVFSHAKWTFETARRDQWLLDIALNNLVLGRAYLLQAKLPEERDYDQATVFLQRAVDGLRKAGELDELPRGLLARAELRRVTGEYQRARADLNEAQRIAERGEMRLHLSDCHLERARLCLALGEREQARAAWQQAAALIAQTGYHRRDGELAEIEEQLG